MSKPFYLAGPMSDMPQFNFPLFDAVASMLRLDGWDIRSPAELDDDAVRAAALASADGAPLGRVDGQEWTWGDFLSRDVKLLADECGGVILLPGWERSKGARLEAFVAVLTGLTVHEYLVDTAEVRERGHAAVMKRISSWVGGEF